MRRKAAGRDAALLPHLRSEADSGRYGQKGGDAMTEYDLRTRRALRQVTLLEFGFGPETMQRCKLCPECGRANPAQDTHCADCGAVLPEKTLYDFYLSRHRCCPGCGVAVTDYAVYCPECGTRLPKAGVTRRKETAV
jgi:hypothetical protein